MAVWWMWVDIDSMLSSISAFQMDLERIQTPHSLFWDSWAEKTFYNLLFTDIQAAEIKFESNLASLSPCLSSGNHSWRLFQKPIKGFDCKMAKLLGQHSGTLAQLWLVWLASTNTGCFNVCCSHCGHNRLARGKCAITLAILTQFESQEGVKFINL